MVPIVFYKMQLFLLYYIYCGDTAPDMCDHDTELRLFILIKLGSNHPDNQTQDRHAYQSRVSHHQNELLTLLI